MVFFPIMPQAGKGPLTKAVRGPASSVLAPAAMPPVGQPEPAIPIPAAQAVIPSLPSMTRMAKNIAGSLARSAVSALKGQGIRISSEEAARRLALCGTCQFFRQTDKRCAKCGCFMAMKTYLRAERCPIGKW